MVPNIDTTGLAIGSHLDPYKPEHATYLDEYILPTTPGSDSNEYISEVSSPKDSPSNASLEEFFRSPSASKGILIRQDNSAFSRAFPGKDCLTVDSQVEIAAVKPDIHRPEFHIIDEFHDTMIDPTFNPYGENSWPSIFPTEVTMQDVLDFDLDQGSDSGFSMNDSAGSSPSPSGNQTCLPSREMSQQPSPMPGNSSNHVLLDPTFQSVSNLVSGRSVSEEVKPSLAGTHLFLAPSWGVDGKAIKKRNGRKRKSDTAKVDNEDSYTERLERASQQNRKQKPHTVPIENPNATLQLTWADQHRNQPYLPIPLPFKEGEHKPLDRPQIYLHPVCQSSHPIKTRVETQIPLRIYVSGLPRPEVSKCHFAPYTVSRPKGLLKNPWVPSPDTLNLDARVVTETAWKKHPHRLLHEAFHDAGKMPENVNPNLSLRRYKVGQDSQEENTEKGPTVKEFTLSDPQNPLNGGPVWICAGCMDRENKRSDRKKSKKPEEEIQWHELQGYRIVMLTSKEVMDWAPVPGGPLGEVRWQYMLDTQMRIVCYCRHHHEKLGYRVIFTLKDHEGNFVAQGLSDLISVTDDHKAEKEKDFGNTQVQKKRKRNPSPDLPVQTKLVSPGRSQRPLSPQDESLRRTSVTSVEQDSLITPSSAFGQHLQQISEPTPHRHRFSQTNSLGLGGQTSAYSGSVGPLTPIPHTPSHNTSSPSSIPTPTLTPQHSLLSPQLGSTDIQFGSPGFSFSFQNSSFSGLQNTHSISALPQQSNHIPSGIMSPMATNAALQSQAYCSRPLAQVHTIIPAEGPTSGGIEICIRGANFTPTTQVMFGSNLASTKTFINDNYLIAILPMGRAGEVPVYNLENARFHGNLNAFTVFKYVDDAEKQIMELALAILGNKLTGQGISPVNLARLILERDQRNGGAQDQSQTQTNSAALEYRIMAAMTTVDEQQTPHPWKLDMKNHISSTLLHMASSMGMQKLVKDLLKRGANPNLRDIHGNTPLHYAAINSHEEVLAQLLLNGANPTYLNARGSSPLRLAGSEEIRTTLKNFMRPRIQPSEGTFSEYDDSLPGSPNDIHSGATSYINSRRTSVISNNGGQFASMNEILASASSPSQVPAKPNNAEDSEKQPAKANYFPYANNVRDMINNSFQGVRERVPTFSAAYFGQHITPPAVPTYQQFLEMYNNFPVQLWQRFGRAAPEADISVPPPSYREVCPEDELTRDEKSALDGLSAREGSPSTVRSSSVTSPISISTPQSASSGVEIIQKESKEELVLRRGQQQVVVSGTIRKMDQMRQLVERASPQNNPDRMLYIFWIPLLVVVVILMLWNMTQTGGGDIRLLLQLAKKTGSRLFQFAKERYREETLHAGFF